MEDLTLLISEIVNIDRLEVGLLASLIAFILIYISSKIRTARYRGRIKFDDLMALDIPQKIIKIEKNQEGLEVQKIAKTKVSVDILSDRIIFKTYNRKLSPEDFERMIPSLNHIYGEKIVDIESKKTLIGQNQIILYLERFPKNYNLEDCPKPPAYSFQIGINGKGENVIQDILNDGEITLAVWGAKGSGKTVAIKSMVRSFYKNNPEHELIIFDFKVNDFLDLAHERGSYLFNMADPEELEQAYLYLRKRVDEHLEYKKFLLDSNINEAKWLNLKRKDKPRPFMLIGDELQQWSSKIQLKKPQKNATPEEIKDYNSNYTKFKLAKLIDHIACVHRAYGNIVILSSQDSRISTYEIDIGSNFRTMLISQQNQQQSIALTGSTIATDKTLKKGKFIYLSDTVKKIAVPFTPNSPIPPNYKRKLPEPMSQDTTEKGNDYDVTQAEATSPQEKGELTRGGGEGIS